MKGQKTFLACGCEIVDKSAAVSANISLFDGVGKPYSVKVYYCTTGKHKGFSVIDSITIGNLQYVLNVSMNYIRQRIRESGYDVA